MALGTRHGTHSGRRAAWNSICQGSRSQAERSPRRRLPTSPPSPQHHPSVMSSVTVESQKSSLRDRFKDKLSLSTTSIRLPRFLSGDPPSPARYQGKPFWTPAEPKEQWYFPPETPPKQETKQEETRLRPRPVTNVLSPQPKREFRSSQLDGLLSPRIPASRQVVFPKNTVEPMTPATVIGNSLTIRDHRTKPHRGDSINGEPCSRVLQDLIQKIPSTWLTTPTIKEAFIPLLRNNKNTIAEKAPTPRELRLIDGFLEHLPELHIVQQKRVKRKQPTNAAQEYKRSLLLNSEVYSIEDGS